MTQSLSNMISYPISYSNTVDAHVYSNQLVEITVMLTTMIASFGGYIVPLLFPSVFKSKVFGLVNAISVGTKAGVCVLFYSEVCQTYNAAMRPTRIPFIEILIFCGLISTGFMDVCVAAAIQMLHRPLQCAIVDEVIVIGNADISPIHKRPTGTHQPITTEIDEITYQETEVTNHQNILHRLHWHKPTKHNETNAKMTQTHFNLIHSTELVMTLTLIPLSIFAGMIQDTSMAVIIGIVLVLHQLTEGMYHIVSLIETHASRLFVIGSCLINALIVPTSIGVGIAMQYNDPTSQTSGFGAVAVGALLYYTVVELLMLITLAKRDDCTLGWRFFFGAFVAVSISTILTVHAIII